MAIITNFTTGGLNLYTNPLIHNFGNQISQDDGQLLRAVNVVSYPAGAKMKRPGYGTFTAGSLPSGTVAQSLFSWVQDNGTSLYTYAASGSVLYYSLQGTGAWAVCGNGTITAGSQMGYAILNNTLVVCQNNGTLRTSTNGTSFTDASGAPVGGFLEQYQNKIFVSGTGDVVTASVTGDPTNWAETGTSDGYTITVPGAGVTQKIFKLDNRLFISKAYGQLFRWDGYYLVDMSTGMGPLSPWSYGTVEDTGIWINRVGVFTSSGDQPQIISAPIRRYFYNEYGTPITSTNMGTAPGVNLRYDWYCAVGSFTDDLTFEPVNNAILRYDFLKNEFLNYSFADFPSSMHTFRDSTGSQRMIFSNAQGQIFEYASQYTNDNGQSVEAIIELLFHFNLPYQQKDWRWLYMFFNPGCQAMIEIAYGDTFLKEELNWIPIGQAVEGVVKYRFPAGSRSRLLYVKIIESSRNSRFDYYGMALDAEPVPLP